MATLKERSPVISGVDVLELICFPKKWDWARIILTIRIRNHSATVRTTTLLVDVVLWISRANLTAQNFVF